MSYCDLESIDAIELPVGKLIQIIAKSQLLFLNNQLKMIDINSAQFQVLYEIGNDSKINQEKIASRSITNKGAIARSISKLEENGLVERKTDENNKRQNIITLTGEGKIVLDKANEIFNEWENRLFEDFNDKHQLQVILKDLAIQSIKLYEDNR